jgi:[ribosomal protein S18]-alanine N-acetyltransferase
MLEQQEAIASSGREFFEHETGSIQCACFDHARRRAPLRPLYNVEVRFQLRDYRREDFERLWQIDQACFPAEIAYSRVELSLYIRRAGSFTLVAETSGVDATDSKPDPAGLPEIVGFVTAEARRRSGHIITIDVIEQARQTGIGSKLLTAAEERLLSAGCSGVSLETAVDNVPALAFYKRHQYFVTGTLRRYYSNGVDALVLKKSLLPPADTANLPT